MRKKERYEKILAWFREHMPIAETELHYDNPFQLLIAVILSAQCTDKRVNMVTPALNNKAKHLVGMARMLLQDFDGQVPEQMEDLLRLPGVGRKTANVIQSVAFNKAAMAVDTHVFRVSHRLGLVSAQCTTPLSVEKELVKNIPETEIPIAHHWLILHGRYICQARTPQCDKCELKFLCKYYSQKYKVKEGTNKESE